MSQYISSFLVEPVIRQARRFSGFNPDSDPEPQSEHQPPQQQQQQQSATEDFPEYVDALDTPLENDAGQCEIRRLEARLAGHDDGAISGNNFGMTRQEYIEDPDVVLLDANDSNRTRAETDPQNATSSGTRRASILAGQFRSTNASFPNSINAAGMRYMEESGRSRQSTGQSSIAEPLAGDATLPEDDGMGRMRERIMKIQDMKVPVPEKSRLMHALMTEQYNTSQLSLSSPHSLRPHSPSSSRSHDRPFTPTSAHSTNDLAPTPSPSTSLSSSTDVEFHLTLQDLEPTYHVSSSTSETLANSQLNLASDLIDEERTLGCAHYKRNVKLQCSACARWHTCRFCHDEVEDHSLNRRETKHMLCMLCGSAQPAAEGCRECGEPAAWYYCGICKLWDNDPEKSIYHCNDCGICRLGQGLGKDFYHCKTCCVCLSISIRDTHRCIERSTDCNCPICGEYMFTSPQTVVFMRCGHSIHHACYREHAQTSFKCPICSRSIVNMEMTFRHLDTAIEVQPMPPEFRNTKAWVYCNDCCAKTLVKYHWLGLKCAVCDSYNTAQLQILSEPSPPAGGAPATNPGESVGIRATGDGADAALILPLEDLHPSRGRLPNHWSHHHRRRRTATSASVLDSMRQSSSTHLPPRRDARSTSASAMDRIAFPDSGSNSDGDDSEDRMDTDEEEEEDDVDFWGGESPRERRAGGTGMVRDQGDGGIEDEESDDDDDDDRNDVMVDDEEEDEDEDSGVEHMDIIGHL